MSLARILREVQYSKLYCSWDPFTDTSCAESWKNSPGQPQSFFCLEIHISLGRCIHVTDVNQDLKCLNVSSVWFFLYLCTSWYGQSSFFLNWIPSEWMELSLALLSLFVPSVYSSSQVLYYLRWKMGSALASYLVSGHRQTSSRPQEWKSTVIDLVSSQKILHLLLGKIVVLYVMLCYFKRSVFS